jgi:hypothetical protein
MSSRRADSSSGTITSRILTDHPRDASPIGFAAL